MGYSKTLSFGNSSDLGQLRHDNQDAFGKFPEDNVDLDRSKGQLFVVADGMGGHRGGREASQLAVETIGEVYSSTSGGITESLRHAFREANQRIYDHSFNHPELFGMGTTCSVLVLKNDRAHIAHIGDSRIYRIDAKRITQLTKDHSKVAELERRGILTKEEARYHPERSLLYRAMGTQREAQIDVVENIEVGPDERFLMCTDGLVNHVEDEELRTIVLEHPPQKACETLIELANRRGGQDNITVIVIQVHTSNDGTSRVKNSPS